MDVGREQVKDCN